MSTTDAFTDVVSTRPATAPDLPFVSPIFGDNMVLQRDKPNTIWGWSTPGNVVRVRIGDEDVSVTADANGRWQARISPPPAGGPYTLMIEGTQRLEWKNVLVGDVWLCSGQSNMEVGLGTVHNAEAEIKAANFPNVRLFMVGAKASYGSVDVPAGSWKVCSPQAVAEGGTGGFSAVGYVFGSRLNAELGIPIGLIQAAVGGTPAEAWTSPEALRPLGDYDAKLDEVDRLRSIGAPEYGNFVQHWYDQYDRSIPKPGQLGWDDPDFDDSTWKAVHVPGDFAELGVAGVPSLCWFRKEITLPDPLPPGNATLYLGSVERMDTTFVNGHWVGASAWVENPRVYPIRRELLKPGRNLVALRVLRVKSEGGGFVAPPHVLRLELSDKTSIPLAGEWKGAVSVDARPPHPLPVGFENWPTMPTVLYRGMIRPLAPLALTGAIWYQGEANTERPRHYRQLLKAMAGSWRELFGQGEFPFYIVTLPAFTHRRAEPGVDDGWTLLREAQMLAARDLTNSGFAVTVDTGDPDDIHPRDKRVVGERLALSVLAGHYGKDIVYAGPTFKKAEAIPGALRLHFDHTDGGLVVKGEKLGEFSVAGKDRKWHWADARVEGDTVVVSSPKVPEPVAARYAWQANPLASLFNGAELPATPFRTDDWPPVLSHKPN